MILGIGKENLALVEQHKDKTKIEIRNITRKRAATKQYSNQKVKQNSN